MKMLNITFHHLKKILHHKCQDLRLVDFRNKYSYMKVHLDMTSNWVLSDVFRGVGGVECNITADFNQNDTNNKIYTVHVYDNNMSRSKVISQF